MSRLARLRSAIQTSLIVLVIVATGFMFVLVATADGETAVCRPFEIYTVESSQQK